MTVFLVALTVDELFIVLLWSIFIVAKPQMSKRMNEAKTYIAYTILQPFTTSMLPFIMSMNVKYLHQ